MGHVRVSNTKEERYNVADGGGGGGGVVDGGIGDADNNVGG